MKNLRDKIETIILDMCNQGYIAGYIEDIDSVTAEIETMIKPLIEALEAADDHLRKSVEEVEGCPYDNCIKHDDGSISCKYEECIHYHAGDLISKALKEFKDHEEDR